MSEATSTPRPPKTTILQFRVTAEERALIEAAAAAQGVSTSELLRAEARRMIGAPQTTAEERAAMLAAARSLAGVANNLNQATKAMHQGKLGASAGLAANIEKTAASVEALRRRIEAAQAAERMRQVSLKQFALSEDTV